VHLFEKSFMAVVYLVIDYLSQADLSKKSALWGFKFSAIYKISIYRIQILLQKGFLFFNFYKYPTHLF